MALLGLVIFIYFHGTLVELFDRPVLFLSRTVDVSDIKLVELIKVIIAAVDRVVVKESLFQALYSGDQNVVLLDGTLVLPLILPL